MGLWNYQIIIIIIERGFSGRGKGAKINPSYLTLLYGWQLAVGKLAFVGTS